MKEGSSLEGSSFSWPSREALWQWRKKRIDGEEEMTVKKVGNFGEGLETKVDFGYLLI